jgi:hypothetical protein
MTCEELKQKVLDGPWPDRELVVQMRFGGDPEIEQLTYEVQVGVGFQDLSDDDHIVIFPCKFDDDPELFILTHEHGKFMFKDEECWIEDMPLTKSKI